MPVAAMRAGDVVVAAQRFAHADGDGFFTDIQMRQAGHERARVELIYIFFEQSNRHHLAIHAQ